MLARVASDADPMLVSLCEEVEQAYEEMICKYLPPRDKRQALLDVKQHLTRCHSTMGKDKG